MAIRVRPGVWACGICGKTYPDSNRADMCRDEHDIIYVPLTPSEINALVNFIFIKEDKLISEALVKKLQRYLRAT